MMSSRPLHAVAAAADGRTSRARHGEPGEPRHFARLRAAVAMTARCANVTRFSACSAPSNSAPSSARFVPESQRRHSRRRRRRAAFRHRAARPGRRRGAGAVIAPDEWGRELHRPSGGRKRDAAGPASAASPRPRRAPHAAHRLDPTAAWTAEAGTITPTTRAIPTSPRRRASSRVCRSSRNELIADSNPDVVSLLEMQVARALALKFDLGCFEGSGTAPEIRGLKNVVGITLDATLAAAPANLDVFAKRSRRSRRTTRRRTRHRDASAHLGHVDRS